MTDSVNKRANRVRSDLLDEGFDVPRAEHVANGMVQVDVRDRRAVAREKVVYYAETHGFEVTGRTAKQDNFGRYHMYHLEDTES